MLSSDGMNNRRRYLLRKHMFISGLTYQLYARFEVIAILAVAAGQSACLVWWMERKRIEQVMTAQEAWVVSQILTSQNGR